MSLVRWLWAGRGLGSRVARGVLLPASLAYRVAAAARARAYDARWLSTKRLPAPAVSVGNLTVGGTGKTPVASWIAGYYCARDVRAGILLRGYGGDEGAVHRGLVPEAIVVEDPDRSRGAEQAIGAGARVLVLDDAFQRMNVCRDLDIGVVSAESVDAVPWTLPAGPWREGIRALRRADLVVVTRKRASYAAAQRVAERVRRVAGERPVAIAHLRIAGFRRLLSNERIGRDAIRGLKVIVACAVADPAALAWQCGALGAEVRLLQWIDHHSFTARDVRMVITAAGSADCVVVTEKDAVKLRSRWPDHTSQPLVADLEVRWERGGARVKSALDNVLLTVRSSGSRVERGLNETEALGT